MLTSANLYDGAEPRFWPGAAKCLDRRRSSGGAEVEGGLLAQTQVRLGIGEDVSRGGHGLVALPALVLLLIGFVLFLDGGHAAHMMVNGSDVPYIPQWITIFILMLMFSVDLCRNFLERKRDQEPVVLRRRKKQGVRSSVPGWGFEDADAVVASITPRRGAGGPPG